MEKTDGSSRRGLMLVLSSPSGAGKGTLSRLLLDPGHNMDGALIPSVSVTTRPRRPSEVDGVHYHFISPAHFLGLRDSGALIEWAEVHGNLYGTPRAPVEEALAKGRDVLFDIDWQGAAQLKEKMAGDVVSIFILPPSMAELKTRLTRRAEDSPETIDKRLLNARKEIEAWARFDYVIVNDDLNEAYADLKAILRAERKKRWRIKEEVERFVQRLMGGG